MRNWHHADLLNRMYCNLPDGKKISMPRYYKLKLYTDGEISLINRDVGQKLLKKQADAMRDNPNYYDEQEAYKLYSFQIRDRKAAQRDKQ